MRFISGKPKTSKHVWYSICETHRQGTKNTCGKAVIKESDQAVMEEYIDKLKILINALGYKVLEPVADPSEAESQTALHLAIGKRKSRRPAHYGRICRKERRSDQ